MAITVASSNSAGPGFTNTGLTITKPTGLAVGDLMVAIFGMGLLSTGGDVVTLSGWTSFCNNIGSGSAGQYERVVGLYKIATSGDVAATNFTFITSSGTSFEGWAGSILRITGAATFSAQTSFANGDNTSSPTFAWGLAPANANSLLIFPAIGQNQGSNPGTSGYAIATSNPTWTEVVDVSNASPASGMTFAVAWAVRPQTTNTGNGSLNWNGSASNTFAGSTLMVIAPAIANSNGNFLTFF